MSLPLAATLIEPRQLLLRHLAKFFRCTGAIIREVLIFDLGAVTDVDVAAPNAGADNIFRIGVRAPALATWTLCIAS
jgi:hypothetical protein